MINSIIVATGLSKRFISREPSFQNSRDHIGRRATDALMGSSDDSSSGPLPILLESAKKNGIPIFSCSFGSDQFDHTSDSLPPDVREFVDERNSILIPPGDSLPTDTIVKGLCRAIEIDRSDLRDRLATLKVVVLGCHTEVAVFQLAQFFRSVIGIKQVSICSHTVASNSNEAHFAMLRHNFPRIGVLVHLDLNDSMSFLGLSHEDTSRFGPCEVEPDTLREAITADQLRLIQMLCLNWTKSTMRPLTGGFSGSLLLLAQGWRGNAKTEPMVVKIDSFKQMRRELLGYYQVKDLLGKNVPTFGYPVDSNELIGVGMELAAMEGTPQTLQDAFEEADHELSLQNFLDRLAKSLDLLSTKLYSNTRQAKWIAPYRKFGLHAQQQLNWLKENSYQLSKYLEEEDSELGRLNIDQVVNLVKVAARNEDGYQSDVCVSHGDLNLANIISDGIDNVWFIDWTHCSEQPLELDFAKLENDIKFVISKDFDLEDASRLAALEEYLIETPIPPEANGLPDRLRFAKWDLRFRKILDSVRLIRESCFKIKEADEWLTYRIALLRYAMHTLSFDARRNRGECEPIQLLCAYNSIRFLALELIADDFNLRIRSERPNSYPERQRISLDEAPWILDSDAYSPPYYVAPEVLEADQTKNADGWAHPEDFRLISDELERIHTRFRDDDGRPLNPRGRTGIAGRGLLGLWGPNKSVSAAIMRFIESEPLPEILLGHHSSSEELSMPKGFLSPGEDEKGGLFRIVETEAGINLANEHIACNRIEHGHSYDPRQTDHSWVESTIYMIDFSVPQIESSQIQKSTLRQIHWWPLKPEIINRMPSDQSKMLRKVISNFAETGRLDRTVAEELLAKTG